MALARQLDELGHACYVLDGDVLRTGLNADLGFSPEDRHENIRRTGEVAALFADAGLICIAALISPYRAGRAAARQACRNGFHEVHVKADLATCEARDPKGLYRRARAGELTGFTGIDAPYEVPERPELVVETARVTLTAATGQLLEYVLEQMTRQPR
jgi:adenylyl-sulfate kinase